MKKAKADFDKEIGLFIDNFIGVWPARVGASEGPQNR
jgi:hypothetical protein